MKLMGPGTAAGEAVGSEGSASVLLIMGKLSMF